MPGDVTGNSEVDEDDFELLMLFLLSICTESFLEANLNFVYYNAHTMGNNTVDFDDLTLLGLHLDDNTIPLGLLP